MVHEYAYFYEYIWKSVYRKGENGKGGRKGEKGKEERKRGGEVRRPHQVWKPTFMLLILIKLAGNMRHS